MESATDVSPGEREPAERAPGPAIALAGVGRDYNEVPVLREVSLELRAGGALSVIGPNGAGKSTLLRILATLLRASSGSVRVLGAELPGEAWKVRGRIGYLGHEPLLYRELTIAENLTFNARLHGIAEAAAATRIESLLEAAGIAHRAGSLVRELSAGLRQRAAVCRALLHEPELLLLDEPRSHLDLGAAESVERMLASAPAATRVTVTHDVEAALAGADSVLALRADGKVAYAGAARGLEREDARAIVGGAR